MLLDVKSLTKRFGGLTAVSNVAFGIERGEIIGIFGPNGSGKTTTLSLIAGILKPTSGVILWKGNDISTLSPFEVAQQGLVKTFQNPQLFPELTVVEHMRIACHLHIKRELRIGRLRTLIGGMPVGLDRLLEQKIDQVLALCRLSSQRNEQAAALSYGGEKMLGVFEEVAKARAASVGGGSVAATAQADAQLTGVLGRLFAVAEAYPELKANTNFLQLQDQLASIEGELQSARRYYNATVRDLNSSIQSFPAVLVAKPLGFSEEPSYQDDDPTIQSAPKVSFNPPAA